MPSYGDLSAAAGKTRAMTCEHETTCPSRPCIDSCGRTCYKCTILSRTWRCHPCRNLRSLAYRDPDNHREYLRAWRAANPDKTRAAAERRRLKMYGLTAARYAEILASQGGACGICRSVDPWRWAVDHDHACCPGQGSCGECVRGILCQNCNAGIAQFRDDPALLAAAISYLGGV